MPFGYKIPVYAATEDNAFTESYQKHSIKLLKVSDDTTFQSNYNVTISGGNSRMHVQTGNVDTSSMLSAYPSNLMADISGGVAVIIKY